MLRMIEAYVSPDVFRRGVNVYLRRFLYGNATAEDFWTALSAASGRPVDKIMPTFVDQAGEPLLTVRSACLNPPATESAGGAQRKAVAARADQAESNHASHGVTAALLGRSTLIAPKKDQIWMAAVCVKSGAAKPFCQILSQKEQTLPLAGCSPWVFVNGSAAGYYRTQYDKADLQKLIAVAGTELDHGRAHFTSARRGRAGRLRTGKHGDVSGFDFSHEPGRATRVVESYLPTLDYVNNYLLAGDRCDAISRLGALQLWANDGEDWLDARRK